MNKLYTAQEVAERLKIKKTTVYELIKRGELESSKIGKQLRISEEQLSRYFQKGSASQQESSISFPGFQPESSLLKRDYLLYSNGLIISGQTSPALEYLIEQMSVHPSGLPVLHSHLNTYNGLYSLYFKKVHATTAGILPEHIPALLPGISTAALLLYEYDLGFYIRKGNPRNIFSAEDLIRPEIILANREKGSTGRMYLDILLKELNISADRINGYQKEHVSDLSTANAVISQQADTAFGSGSVAFQLKNMDFIPVKKLPMFLVMEKDSIKKPGFSALIDIVRSREFQTVLEMQNGCGTSRTGELMYL